MTEFDIIPADEPAAWMLALQQCGSYDVYHLPQYHLLAEEMGEGKPFLFFFRRKGACAALPFLLRPIAGVAGLEGCRYNDITSVYGYPGVVCSIDDGDEGGEEFQAEFQAALAGLFERLSVVAFFSRTNPLLHGNWLFRGDAEILPLSVTVAIDLSGPDRTQQENMTKGHRYDIRKARRDGVVVEQDHSFGRIDDFMSVYNESMQRAGAHDYYYFPREYYLRLKSSLGDSVQLYLAKFDGHTVSAALFFLAGRNIQYHLSGTCTEFLSLGGSKVIIDEVRQWGGQNGYAWLHLGGGVGSTTDALFRFKAGFSKVRLPFEVVRKVVNHEAYGELCLRRGEWVRNNGYTVPESGYFPVYRKPYSW
jgi:hypothetical protein